MLEKVAIKNGQSIETDNCITTIIYILSFTIFMYQAQLINTEILSDKIKRNTHLFSFLCSPIMRLYALGSVL